MSGAETGTAISDHLNDPLPNREGPTAKNHGVGPRRQFQRQPRFCAAAMKDALHSLPTYFDGFRIRSSRSVSNWCRVSFRRLC